jgi:hypothetical protein
MSTATETAPVMALAVVVKGEVVSSNLVEFRASVNAYVAKINKELKTDSDFGQAEIDVKSLKKMEELHKLAEERVLSQAEGINALLKELAESNLEVSRVRLDLEATIKRQKDSVKARLVTDALNLVECAPHLRLKTFGTIIEGAIKGKKTLESMEKSLLEIVGSLNEQLRASYAVIAEYEAANEVVPDKDALALGAAENVRLEMARRKQAREAAEEKKRLEKIADDERNARLKAEAEMKREREANEKAQREAHPVPSEAERSQEWERREMETKATFATAPAPAPVVAQPVVKTDVLRQSPEKEMQQFQEVCLEVFAKIKAARGNIVHEENAAKIDAFRAAINNAWKLMKGGNPS